MKAGVCRSKPGENGERETKPRKAKNEASDLPIQMLSIIAPKIATMSTQQLQDRFVTCPHSRHLLRTVENHEKGRKREMLAVMKETGQKRHKFEEWK